MAEQSQLTGAIGGAGQGAATGAMVGGVPGAVVGGVIGAVGGFLGGGGEDEAKELANDQARVMRRTARENRRRRMQELRQQTGMMQAQTAASGLSGGGSMDRYRSAVEAEYRSQIDWDYGTDLKNARLVQKGGQAAANQIQSAGIGQMISGLTSLGTAYAGGAFKKPNYVYKGDSKSLGEFGTYDQPGSIGHIEF